MRYSSRSWGASLFRGSYQSFPVSKNQPHRRLDSTHEFDGNLLIVEKIGALKDNTKRALSNLLANAVVHSHDVGRRGSHDENAADTVQRGDCGMSKAEEWVKSDCSGGLSFRSVGREERSATNLVEQICTRNQGQTPFNCPSLPSLPRLGNERKYEGSV